MRAKALVEFLTAAMGKQLPVLVTGAPGIGKSDIAYQATKNLGAELIISHPVVSDPTDAKGLPWIGKGKDEATFLPFGELAKILKATKPTVWFIDDLGQASPAVQASYMQPLLTRLAGGRPIPDCVSIIAATNRRTDRAGVAGILEPVKSRFVSIVELEANADDWCHWAVDAGIPWELIAFMRFRPNLLSDFKPTADMQNSPSPRTWHSVSKLLSLNLPDAIQFEAVCGAVGPGAGAEFTAYLDIVRKLPNLDQIIIDPQGAPLPQRSEPSTCYAVAAGLASKTNLANFDSVAAYAERMAKNNLGEFGVLLVRDAVRRVPEISGTYSFTRMATSSELGQLIAGN